MDRTHVTTAPTHTLSGRDSVNKTETSRTDTPRVEKSNVATPNYSKRPSGTKFKFFPYISFMLVYYRIYAEDGAIFSKTSVTPSDPFLGRIKARSVPPPGPLTVKAVKRSIASVEDIKDREKTSLFLTPYSQSPMDDADKVTILNGTGPGSTPQEPLALVAKMSNSERNTLEFDGRVRLASAAGPDTTSPEIRYGASIQHSSTFLFHNISTVGESVLSALRQRL